MMSTRMKVWAVVVGVALLAGSVLAATNPQAAKRYRRQAQNILRQAEQHAQRFKAGPPELQEAGEAWVEALRNQAAAHEKLAAAFEQEDPAVQNQARKELNEANREASQAGQVRVAVEQGINAQRALERETKRYARAQGALKDALDAYAAARTGEIEAWKQIATASREGDQEAVKEQQQKMQGLQQDVRQAEEALRARDAQMRWRPDEQYVRRIEQQAGEDLAAKGEAVVRTRRAAADAWAAVAEATAQPEADMIAVAAAKNAAYAAEATVRLAERDLQLARWLESWKQRSEQVDDPQALQELVTQYETLNEQYLENMARQNDLQAQQREMDLQRQKLDEQMRQALQEAREAE